MRAYYVTGDDINEMQSDLSNTHLKLNPLIIMALSCPWTSLQYILNAGMRQTEEPQASVSDGVDLVAGMTKPRL